MNVSSEIQHKRRKQVAAQIKREMAYLIQCQVRDPRLKYLSIITVALSNNGHDAVIYYIARAGCDLQVVQEGLTRATPYLRTQLAERSKHLRYIPKIRFKYDHSIEHARAMLALIDGCDEGS